MPQATPTAAVQGRTDSGRGNPPSGAMPDVPDEEMETIRLLSGQTTGKR